MKEIIKNRLNKIQKRLSDLEQRISELETLNIEEPKKEWYRNKYLSDIQNTLLDIEYFKNMLNE